jgi:hypothetical protein
VTLALHVTCITRQPRRESSRGAAGLPRAAPMSYDSTMVFPGDRSLARPEDGIAFPDG